MGRGNVRVRMTVMLTRNEREKFKKIADDWHLDVSDVLRRAALVLIKKTVSMDEILRKPSVQNMDEEKLSREANDDYNELAYSVSTTLFPEEKKQLTALVENWGFKSISPILRRFVRALIFEDIPRICLWETWDGKEKSPSPVSVKVKSQFKRVTQDQLFI